jgi:hypothetical protein
MFAPFWFWLVIGTATVVCVVAAVVLAVDFYHDKFTDTEPRRSAINHRLILLKKR